MPVWISSSSILTVVIALAVCFMLLLVWLFLLQQVQGQWQAQCQRYLPQQKEVLSDKPAANNFFAGLGVLYPVSEKEADRLKQMLEHAGINVFDALNKVRGAKLFLGLTVSCLALVWQGIQGELFTAFTLMLTLVGYVIGSNLPEYWLRHQVKSAKQKQHLVVADVIDLMVICIEAGLSLERSLEKVGHYSMNVEPMLAKQILRTHAEIQVRGESALCLKKLAWRTGLKEIERLASTLAMAERYGSPLAETMRTISHDARQMRKMGLQEQAGKLPSKITLIQMLFIMLPLLVLIVAPTMNLLLESLK